MATTQIAMRRGFTLIELLVTLSIIAILSAVAYPSYVKQLQKSRRTDGETALLRVAGQLERYYTENNSYAAANLANLNLPTSSDQGFYRIILQTTASTYTIQAIPNPPQNLDLCGTLSLNQLNQRGAAGGNCW